MKMTRFGALGILLTLAVLLTGVDLVKAESFVFTYSDILYGISGEGWLTATDLNNDGIFVVTDGGVTLVRNGETIDFDLVGNPNSPNYATSPLGAFWYDNLLYPFNQPVLDTYGLLFFGFDPNNNKLELNIWGNAPGTFYSAYTGLWQGNYPVHSDNVTFNIGEKQSFTNAPVPEPATLLLMGFGSGVMGAGIRRLRGKKKKS
jgi:hypothetical protein